MPRCCGGSSCACVIQAGPHTTVVGTGHPSDPFVITADVDLEVLDTSTIDLTLTGPGSDLNPWVISGRFANSSKLNDLGDVNVAPTNGQVLSWNTSLGEWQAVAPTTAAAGAVLTDSSLSGDGSAGTPLQVREDPARMLATVAGQGLGLTDTGMNSLVRHYADTTARAAAAPPPGLNAMSTLDTNPGQIDYWNGSGWGPAGLFQMTVTGGELYVLSGSYTGSQRITLMVRNIVTSTNSAGQFDLVPATDLAGRAGVLAATVTPTTGGQALGAGIPWTCVVAGDSGALKATAYRLDDGVPLPSQPISALVIAYVY